MLGAGPNIDLKESYSVGNDLKEVFTLSRACDGSVSLFVTCLSEV